MATSTRPGDLLAGRYRLIDLLAESGGGRFWRAQDTILERYVALHVIAEDDPRAPELLTAARKSATFHDRRVLRVLDAATTDSLCYVVNEWGTGTSLDVLVTDGGPLGPRRSSWLVAEVASAIATAHQHDVTHGRLNPEAVLIDRFGAIRLIGLGVDAALHGLPPGRRSGDRADLAGLLYCCLTGTWPGPSPSQVHPAPREHDAVLPPRRVRAGVPRPLDEIWREIVDRPHRRRATHEPPDVSTARAIHDRLLEFIGDPTGLPQALASSIPAINELQPVDLPSVADPLPHPEPTAEHPAVGAEPEPTQPVVPPEPGSGAGEPETADEEPTQVVEAAEQAESDRDADDEPTQVVEAGGADADLPEGVSISDLPTEAGMPVFDDDGDEVEWFRAGHTPPPPPPPLEEPPARPLFAPEPDEGEPVRRPREGAVQPKPARLDPMRAGPAPPPPASPWEPDLVDTAEQPTVPGRSWLRLAMVLAAALLLLLALVVAFNLGRGRTPLGGEREDPASPSPSVPAEALTDADVRDFDPFGTPPEENSTTVQRTVDGDADTTWRTSTYLQQLGPSGLKTGVGLLLDLQSDYEVTEVELTLVGAPTEVELHVVDDAPTDAPGDEPVAIATADGTTVTLEPEEASGRYAIVWFTALPSVPGGFRAEVAEVVVRGR